MPAHIVATFKPSLQIYCRTVMTGRNEGACRLIDGCQQATVAHNSHAVTARLDPPGLSGLDRSKSAHVAPPPGRTKQKSLFRSEALDEYVALLSRCR